MSATHRHGTFICSPSCSPWSNGVIPEERARELFDEWRGKRVTGGFVLFPKRRYPRTGGVAGNVIREDVNSTSEQADAATDEHGGICLWVAACINYSFASDPTKNHQTSCLFEVQSKTTGFLTRTPGTSIPETDLRLRQVGFLGMDLAD